tara:strand:- start:2131 stop:2706 length:576 start_codon:yes stop_codon:yes gene_type:complete
MAEERKIDLKKGVYGKTEYLKTIDTSFRELGVTTIAETIEEEPNIEEFFDQYNSLFYDIPAQGEINSHQFLVEQSGEYINYNDQTEEIQALRAEIANLRRENLNLQINSIKEGAGAEITNELDELNRQMQEIEAQQEQATAQIAQTQEQVAAANQPEEFSGPQTNTVYSSTGGGGSAGGGGGSSSGGGGGY